MRRLLALLALVVAAGIGNAQAATITFEDHAVPFGTALPQSGDPTSGGFFFDMASNAYQFANNSARVDDGSTYIVIQGALQGPPISQTTFSQIGGTPFALTSLDFAEWQSDLPAVTRTLSRSRSLATGSAAAPCPPCSCRTASSMGQAGYRISRRLLLVRSGRIW